MNDATGTRAPTPREWRWYTSGDIGISSRTIFQVMTGLYLGPTFYPGVPHDPDDFGRCRRLLERFPEWVDRMPEVAARYPRWRALVLEWARLTELYDAKRDHELYEAIKRCLVETP